MATTETVKSPTFTVAFDLIPAAPGAPETFQYTDESEKWAQIGGRVKVVERAAWLAYTYGSCDVVPTATPDKRFTVSVKHSE